MVGNPSDLMRLAIAKGGNLDQLERFMQMQLAWEANEARKAYVAAMAEFKRDPPTIIKNKKVSFDTSKGKTSYMHATIGNVVGLTIAALAKHGFSHRWDIVQKDGGAIEVTCILTHAFGHSEKVSLQASRDDSGSKNPIQAVSSAVSYLQRYTILAVCGLATNDQMDDDGIHGGSEQINAQQVEHIKDLMEQAGAKGKFLEWCKVSRVEEINAGAYVSVCDALEEKIRGKAK